MSETDVACIPVDLASHGVSAILGIALLCDDTAVLIHADGDRGGILLVSLPALVDGKVAWMGGAELDNASAIRRIAVGGDSTVAMLEEGSSVSLSELQIGKEVKRVYIQGLGEGGALCVGVSPGGELVAVGVECGSLYLYDVGSLERKGEIIVVESGWVPFAIVFITEEDVLVGYAKDSRYHYIVWTLTEDDGREGALLANTRSMLGELCYPALSLPPSEDEGEGDDKGAQNEPSTPMVFCSPIPGWPICVVSSSCSSDIEVIARKEEGDGWEIWKFDEGKSAVLPMGDADNDSKPLGIGLDLTDTVEIDPIDPSAPKINPMPRLIALTTEGELVPFALIDDRKGASCDAVKKTESLPPVLSFPRPAGNTNSTEGARKVESINTHANNDSRGLHVSTGLTGNFGADQNKWSRTEPAFGFKAENMSSFGKVLPQPGFAWADALGTPRAKQGETVQGGPGFSFEPQIRRPWNDSLSSEESDDDERDIDEDERRLTSSASPTDEEDGTERGSIQSVNAETSFPEHDLAFSGTENFLSKFEFVDLSDKNQRTEESKLFPSISRPPTSRSRRTEPPRGEKMSTTSSLAPISLPAYPLQPSFEEASAAASTGKPEDLIRSVLLEMKQELDYNRQAQVVMMKRTQAVAEAIMPRVDAVKDDLGGILQDIREYFRGETALRKVVGDSLSEITARSKEFETTCLEFRIREEEGFSRDIQPEDKLVDEQISRKELAVTKSIEEIESRLRTERMSRGRRWSQVERIQHIYSSLSLQGLRIRRVCGLLATLAARVNELENSGRRSDLGLSVARLEKLARSENPSTVRGNAGSLAPSPTKPASSIRTRTPGGLSKLDNTLSVPDHAEGEFHASKEVLSVLRRLAMRGGRANIEAKSSRTLFERNNSVEQSKPQLPDMGDKHRGSTMRYRTEEEEGDSRAMTSSSQPPAFDTASGFQNTGYDNSTQLLRSSMVSTKEELPKLGPDSVATGTGQTSSGSSQAQDQFSAALNATNTNFPFPSKRDSATVHSTTGTVAIESNGFEKSTPSRVSDVYGESLKSTIDFLGSSGAVRSSKKLKDETHMAPLSAQSASTGLFASPAYESPQLKAPPKPETLQAFDRNAPLPSGKSEVITVAGKGVGDGELVMNLTATLPPDDFAESAPLPPDDFEARGFHAPLPPDDDVKNSLRTSLPPKRREETHPIASVPPRSANTDGSGGVATPSDLTDRSPAAGPPDERSAPDTPSNSHHGSSSVAGGFAALPPDELDGKGFLTGFSERFSIQEKDENPLEAMRREGESRPANELKSDAVQRGSESLSSREGDGIQSKVGTNAFGQDSNESSLPASGKSGSVFTFGSDAKTVTPFVSAADGGVLGGQSRSGIQGNATEHDVFISDESDAARKGDDREIFGMDTPMMQSDAGKGFRSMATLSTSIGQAESISPFGSAQTQSFAHSMVGQIATGSAPLTSNSSMVGSQAAQSSPGIFGTGDSSSSRGFGFIETPSSIPALSGSGEGFGAKFGSSSGFGQLSPIGGANAFGAAAAPSGSAQFGVNSTFGGNNYYGSSQFGAGFGETSQLGAGSPFNTLGGGGSSGFGSATPAFGKGMSSATFGEVSSFGAGQSGEGSFGGTNAYGSANASPFSAVSGGGFGGQSDGGSGFAVLATSQGFGGSGGSAFGNSVVPVFGNDNRPPVFTSAAFSERRA